MRDVVNAITAGLWAPVRRPKLVLFLWLARLVPIFLFFTLPLLGALREEMGKNPDARRTLDAGKDESGLAWSLINDFVAKFDPAERVFWVGLASSAVVAVLAGGLVAAFVLKPEGPVLVACGRFACRFLRLFVVAVVLLYLADMAVNGILLERHLDTAREQFTQEYATKRGSIRGILFAAIALLLHAVHSYARIDMVANDRRSALVSFGRGFGILFARLPKLLLIELSMLVASGVAVLLAWFLARIARPSADAGWVSFGCLLLALALPSYLRTAFELGTLEARCRLLVPPAPALSPLEAVLGTPRDAA